MGIRKLLGRRRGLILVAATCMALGIGSTLAIQQATASTPTVPQVVANPGPTLHPTNGTGQVLPSVTATNAVCGQLITASLTLNGNLFCSGGGNGLNVGGKSVVLNLNGFGIYGGGYNAGGAGVNVIGTTATVENGQISTFTYGVLVSGATANITKLRTTFGGSGIYAGGAGDKITSNEAFGNEFYGIAAYGNGQTVTTNRVSTNGLASTGYSGLYLGGTKDIASGNIVTNTQGGPGIYDIGYNTTLTSNTANFNQADGIRVFDSDLIDGGGNLAKGNDTVPAGSVPEQCYDIVCN